MKIDDFQKENYLQIEAGMLDRGKFSLSLENGQVVEQVPKTSH